MDRKRGTPSSPPENAGRAAFRFVERVGGAFAFLLNRGFRVVAEEPTYVRFESDRVFVAVFHGRRSYEVGVELGRLASRGDPEEPGYDLLALGEAADSDSPPASRPFAATRPDQIEPELARLAERLRRDGADALDGDPFAFRRLEEYRRRCGKALAKEVMLSDVRERAEAAWKARDHARVVELYASIRDELTPVEVKRLQYCRTRGNRP